MAARAHAQPSLTRSGGERGRDPADDSHKRKSACGPPQTTLLAPQGHGPLFPRGASETRCFKAWCRQQKDVGDTHTPFGRWWRVTQPQDSCSLTPHKGGNEPPNPRGDREREARLEETHVWASPGPRRERLAWLLTSPPSPPVGQPSPCTPNPASAQHPGGRCFSPPSKHRGRLCVHTGARDRGEAAPCAGVHARGWEARPTRVCAEEWRAFSPISARGGPSREMACQPGRGSSAVAHRPRSQEAAG